MTTCPPLFEYLFSILNIHSNNVYESFILQQFWNKKMSSDESDDSLIFELYVESEMNDVAVFHNIFFTFQTGFARVFRFEVAASFEQVVLGNRLCTDESFLEVSMDDAGTFRGRHTFFKCPRTDFLNA